MWSDKYSPKHIDDLIIDNYVKNKINGFLHIGEISNIIINGACGSGKTTILNCMAHDFYKDTFNNYVYKLNSSIEKNVKILHEMLELFCKQKIITVPQKKKLFIIDDIDMIPEKLQNVIALMMENYPNIYFTFSCNSTSLVNELIQSRCLILYIQRPENSKIINHINKICKNEEILCSNDVIERICDISQWDLRLAINTLHVLSINNNKITIDNINNICDVPNQILIQNLLLNCVNKKYKDALKIGISLHEGGYDSSTILSIMFDCLKSFLPQIQNENKMKMLKIIGKMRYNICRKNDSILQLELCIIKLCGL
jgi:DNA polymerase III delta prime subunit